MRTPILCLILFIVPSIHAQDFENIDGHAHVVGKPNPMPSQARENWVAACEQWKIETKDLNRNNIVMMMSCETPACGANDAMYSCESDAIFKVKTAGGRVVPKSTAIVTETPPPQVLVESVPAPRPGFVWISGYWGWQTHRHYWYPGHWESHRPGYLWIGPRWTPHGHRWAFRIWPLAPMKKLGFVTSILRPV